MVSSFEVVVYLCVESVVGESMFGRYHPWSACAVKRAGVVIFQPVLLIVMELRRIFAFVLFTYDMKTKSFWSVFDDRVVESEWSRIAGCPGWSVE